MIGRFGFHRVYRVSYFGEDYIGSSQLTMQALSAPSGNKADRDVNRPFSFQPTSSDTPPSTRGCALPKFGSHSEDANTLQSGSTGLRGDQWRSTSMDPTSVGPPLFVKNLHQMTNLDTSYIEPTVLVDPGPPVAALPVRFPSYVTAEARRKSFINSPSNLAPLVERLVAAGFFFRNQVPDMCACFMCGNHLYNWKVCDLPMVAHATNYPTCSFLSMVA